MRKKILIGDGEAWAVALFDQAARALGVDVYRVLNGIDALEKFKTLAPSLVVLDTLLPKLDGLQVASKIQDMELGRITPIVITSAIYRRGPEVDALRRNHGFTDFLEKPFDLPEVEALLARRLRDEPEAPAEERELEDVHDATGLDHTVRHFSQMGISRILVDVNDGAKSGILTFRHGAITKILFFVDGLMTHALSNSRRDLMGRTLLRNGWISKDEYARARELQLESAGKLQLGSALVQLNVLNEGEVINAVSSQILSIVFSLFSWQQGAWTFVETTNIPERYRRFSFNPANIVFWGLRRLEGRMRFAPFLPSSDSVVEIANDAPELRDRLNLTYFEEQLLALVDGKQRLGEIVSIGRLAHLDVERVLFALLTVGVLRVRPQDDQAAIADVAEPGPLVDAQGDLRTTRLARVLGALHLARRSGVLCVTSAEGESKLWLDGGEIVSAASEDQRFKLTDILLRAGKITESSRDRAVKILRSDTHRRIGAVLLELRALSLDELHWALRHQVQAIALALLGRLDGQYAFTEGAIEASFRVSIDMSTANLILEAARVAEPPSDVQTLMGSDALLVKVWDDARVAGELRLSSAELRLLRFLEGGRPARETLSLGLMTELDLARVADALLSLGVIKASVMSSSAGAETSRRQLELAEATALGREVDDESEETIELGVEKIYERLKASSSLEDENANLKEALELLEKQLRALKPPSDGG